MLKPALNALKCVFASVSVALCTLSCKGPTNDYWPLPDELPRYVDLHGGAVKNGVVTHVGVGFEGAVPLEVAMVVEVGSGLDEDYSDETRSEYRDPLFNSIEIDFGNGSSWYDATADSKTKWIYYFPPYFESTHSPEHMTLHTYTTPGEYIIRVRVTFWDGEVLYADQVPFHVLPAGNAS